MGMLSGGAVPSAPIHEDILLTLMFELLPYDNSRYKPTALPTSSWARQVTLAKILSRHTSRSGALPFPLKAELPFKPLYDGKMPQCFLKGKRQHSHLPQPRGGASRADLRSQTASTDQGAALALRGGVEVLVEVQGLRLKPKLKRRLTYPAGGIC